MDPQIPFDGPQRHALAPGFLDRFPSLLLQEGRLARSDGQWWHDGELAKLVFNDPLATSRPDPFPTEQRRRTIGEVRNVVIIVVHTEPEPDYTRGEAVGRIISARKAERRERNAYETGEF